MTVPPPRTGDALAPRPVVRRLRRPRGRPHGRPRLPPADRRRPDARERLLQGPRGGPGLPVRERRRRRAAGPVFVPRVRPVPDRRGVRPARDDQARPRPRRGIRPPGPAAEAGRAVDRLSRAARAGVASLRRRGGRLRRLRHGALRRAVAERPGRRPRPARPELRLLRPHGHLRPHQQDRACRGSRPRRSGRPRRLLRQGMRGRRSVGRAFAPGRGRPAGNGHRPAGRGRAAVRVELRGRRRIRRRSSSARSTSRPGTPSRWC